MPNKRSRRGRTKKFFCHICEERLWRLGKDKYYLFYQDASEVRKNTGMSAKKAKLFLAKSKTYLDRKKWIEQFYCPNHGNLWLTVTQKEQDYHYRCAKPEDWQRTSRTTDPTKPNPTVSEYSQKMSRDSYVSSKYLRDAMYS